jgi:hypothetical protein
MKPLRAQMIHDMQWQRLASKTPKAYVVAASLFLSHIGTCEVERLAVCYDSRFPLHQESPGCVSFAISSIG